MKKTLYVYGMMVLLLCAASAFAQGPFADVPTDHWAYDAVNELQQKGIVIGYPDGTFGGKRAMTRYEFAMAISRMLPMLDPQLADRVAALESRMKAAEDKMAGMKGEGPAAPGADMSGYVTKADLAKIQKLADEFKDELAQLGVDVDAMRKDLAALTERVAAIEAKMERMNFSFSGFVAGIMPQNETADVISVDIDNRPLSVDGEENDLLDNVTFLRHGELKWDMKINPTTSAYVNLAVGNYLPYLTYVDDYIGVFRPTNKTTDDGQDDVFPYWLGMKTQFGPVHVEVGRIPIQWTPYTIKKVDVEEILTNDITDSGDYPIDGGKIKIEFGKNAFLQAFAAKNNSNKYVAGLVALPNGGIYRSIGSFHAAGGYQMGGLGQIEQSAGARLGIGFGEKNALGLTYIQAGQTGGDFNNYDKAELLGADLVLGFGNLMFRGEYAETKTKGISGNPDIEDQNAAWDGKLYAKLGGLGIGAGYRQIESNFAAPGSWGKIGRWANPVNIKGPYVNLDYSFSSNFSIAAVGEFYKMVDDITALNINEEDKVDRAKVDLRFALSPKTSIGAGYEWVQFKLDAGGDKAKDKYWNFDLTHKINPEAMLRIGYQIVDYTAGDVSPYGENDFEGNVGYVQIGVKF